MDVNQIAAGMADSLEASRCSAIRRRLLQWQHDEALLSLEEFYQQDRPDLQLELEDMLQLLNCNSNFLAPISERGPLILVGDLSETPRIIVPPLSSATLVTPAAEDEQPHAAVHNKLDKGSELISDTGAEQLSPATEPVAALEPVGAEAATLPEQEDAREAVVEHQRQGERVRFSRTDRAAAPPTYEIHRRQKAKLKPRASDNPYLDVPPLQYRDLVTWSAERLKGKVDPTDEVPAPLAELLANTGIEVGQWLTLIGTFETAFHSAVGAVSSLKKFLQRTDRTFIHGIRACRSAFT